MSSSTPSRRGLGVPMREREDKDTQDGIKPPARPRQTPLPHMKPPSFVWNVVCVSAQKSYRLIGISPPHRLFPTRHPPRKDKNIIAKNGATDLLRGSGGGVSAQCDATTKKTEATRFRRVVILPRGLTALAKCERPRNRCRHRLFRRSFAAYPRQS